MAAVLELRAATGEDLPAIAALYDHYVQHCACTFDTEPPSTAYWQSWLAEHRGAYAVIVAIRDGGLVGWGSLSKWSKRCAYRFSVEDSVYVQPQCQGQGIGKAILGELIRQARLHGHRNIIAQIADGQPASEALHSGAGFKQVGHLDQVGYKFGRWVGVGIWQLQLDEGRAADGSQCCAQT